MGVGGVNFKTEYLEYGKMSQAMSQAEKQNYIFPLSSIPGGKTEEKSIFIQL